MSNTTTTPPKLPWPGSSTRSGACPRVRRRRSVSRHVQVVAGGYVAGYVEAARSPGSSPQRATAARDAVRHQLVKAPARRRACRRQPPTPHELTVGPCRRSAPRHRLAAIARPSRAVPAEVDGDLPDRVSGRRAQSIPARCRAVGASQIRSIPSDDGVPQIDAFEIRLDWVEHLARLRRIDRLKRAGHAYCRQLGRPRRTPCNGSSWNASIASTVSGACAHAAQIRQDAA